ncbi:unnamed protein product [Cuscuta europaea]|uniref:Protein kinase domain-containing protein n=1 Tax=Cuscuta europaea TaxID=41803 RepID=A0A9P0YRU1_CUSEU|nr:unnamed protein product [Cuscuta europaea]
MCRTKMAVNASSPAPSPSQPSSRVSVFSSTPRIANSRSSEPPISVNTSAEYNSAATNSPSFRLDTSVATAAVSSSLSNLRQSLPDRPQVYDFSEIRAATNNFLSKRYSSTSSSQSWQCVLHGKQVIIFQRIVRRSIEKSGLRAKLSIICRSHNRSIVKLLGASISGNQIYLVYEFVPGSNLALCLRNPRNPSYTVISTWLSRMQIATDVAHGLDYIHNMTGQGSNSAHKHVKSSGIVITEPSFNAKICHFGAAELCGETEIPSLSSGESTEELCSTELRSEKRNRQFEGVSGYMSPDFQLSGIATPKSDVYAFGVVLLELFSGEEPVKFKYDKSSGEYMKISVVETARDAIGGGAAEEMERGLRQWVDGRLKDSFPVEVAAKVIRLALDCIHVDPKERPDMRRVSGKISQLFLESEYWSAQVQVPTAISVSFTPR